MSPETNILLLMLGISKELYLEHIHGLAAKWEKSHHLNGASNVAAIQGWFIDAANKSNYEFFNALSFTAKNELELRGVGRDRKPRTVKDKEAIIVAFKENLTHLRHLRYNSAVAEFIQSKPGNL